MRDERMERTVIVQADLLTMSQRAPGRQFVSHVYGGHPKKNRDEKDCRNKN